MREKVVTIFLFIALASGLTSCLGVFFGGPRSALSIGGMIGMYLFGLAMFAAIVYDVIKSR